jgi:hypothetical protein
MARLHVARGEHAVDQLGWDSIRVELEHELELDAVTRQFGSDMRDAVRKRAHRQHEHRVDPLIDSHRLRSRRKPRAV